MDSNLYIPRRLLEGSKVYSEADLLESSNHIIVLAEPGAGKTMLMDSLASQLGTSRVTATTLGYVGVDRQSSPLVIDAFDEFAKLEPAGVYKLLAEVRKSNPTRVIVSSRSSEWDYSSTKAFENIFRMPPLIVKLKEFNESEQQQIFDHYTSQQDFKQFRQEVTRFDLQSLLPNPQFLKLFTDAYIESNGQFSSKSLIFSQAVEHLAKEANEVLFNAKSVLTTRQKVDLSCEIFAKLLLSGAEGVSSREVSSTKLYPYLASLFDCENSAESLIATRLFKPSDNVDYHCPVHKIVVEYSAALYLARRIDDSSDPLSLGGCLAVVAPKSVVRDELRGLLGWMASVGNQSVQEEVIRLDPYAVLANGDPSQLLRSSKRLLISQLQEISLKDPLFRRGDFWRRFSVAGFFSTEIISELQEILLSSSTHVQLRDLILELLIGSQATDSLEAELRHIYLSENRDESTRILASNCVFEVTDYDYLPDLEVLIDEASRTSLSISAKIVETFGAESIGVDLIARLLEKCADLYQNSGRHNRRAIGSFYFIVELIDTLSIDIIEGLIESLVSRLEVPCGNPKFKCDRNEGKSKVIGRLIDRYFGFESASLDASKIWRWLKMLRFKEGINPKDSKSVDILQHNHQLRQEIIALAFSNVTDKEQIKDIKVHHFCWKNHCGLRFQACDYIFLSDLAFREGNVGLWSCFIENHDYYRDASNRGPNELRKRMRSQANGNPEFMKEWVVSNRAADKQFKDGPLIRNRFERRNKRAKQKKNRVRRANIQFVRDNRDLIKQGKHWKCLESFARLVLNQPDDVVREYGDEGLVRTALINSLDSLKNKIPSLGELAALQCKSQYLLSEEILYAACIVLNREVGSIETVDSSLLKALRTNLNSHYNSVKPEEQQSLKDQIDALLFKDKDSVQSYLQEYLEPQIANKNCLHPEVNLLSGFKVFDSISQASIALKWLKEYSDINIYSTNSLFEIVAEHGNRADIDSIILERCDHFINKWPNNTESDEIESLRNFWFLRAFYFLDTNYDIPWNWLKSDKDSIHLINEKSGRFNAGDCAHWPKLNARKVELVLNAYIDVWPKVDLPSSWGTCSPKSENAYRLLTEVVWLIDSDEPAEAIPVIERLLLDTRFSDFHNALKSIRAGQLRKSSLVDYTPPSPKDVVEILDRGNIMSVEGLRDLVMSELRGLQNTIDGGEFNTANRFYNNGTRLNENNSTEVIAERLNLKLEPRGISVTPEHQLKGQKRSDFTVTKLINGKRRLLVAEVKGQWHSELYTAASAQLYERYSIHPDAEQQGIYLVLWFGADEMVAGKKKHGIQSANELRDILLTDLPDQLKGTIDVFVLDVSRD